MGSLSNTTPRPFAPSHSSEEYVCRCRQHDCKECYGHKKGDQRRRIKNNLISNLQEDRKVLHVFAQLQDKKHWASDLGKIKNAIRCLAGERRKQSRRKKPGPLTQIIFADSYPHFTIQSEGVRPHLHLAMVVEAEVNEVRLLRAMNRVTDQYGVTIERGELMDVELVPGYLTGEPIHAEEVWRKDIAHMLRGERWPQLRQLRRTKVRQNPTHTGQDRRHVEWEKCWGEVVRESQWERVPMEYEGIGENVAQRKRLPKLIRLILSAHRRAVAYGADTFGLPVRRIACDIGVSPATIQRDIAWLIGSTPMLSVVQTKRGNPKEYRYHDDPTTNGTSADTWLDRDATRSRCRGWNPTTKASEPHATDAGDHV